MNKKALTHLAYGNVAAAHYLGKKKNHRPILKPNQSNWEVIKEQILYPPHLTGIDYTVSDDDGQYFSSYVTSKEWKIEYTVLELDNLFSPNNSIKQIITYGICKNEIKPMPGSWIIQDTLLKIFQNGASVVIELFSPSLYKT